MLYRISEIERVRGRKRMKHRGRENNREGERGSERDREGNMIMQY